MKKFLIILLICSIFLYSCYQTPESSSGAVSINLNTASKGAPAGFDGELRLAVFPEGFDSLIDDSGMQIKYLAELPTPLLANNSVPINGRNGVISLLNVPSDMKLNLLVEYDGPLYDGGSDYYNSYSGVSDAFEVGGGDTTEVSIDLYETADGSVIVNKGPIDTSSGYFRVFDPADYDSFITTSGSDITNLNYIDFIYTGYGASSTATSLISNLEILPPGRKLRLIVSENSGIDNGSYPDVGISGEFEVQPGLAKSVPVTYYTYTSCSYFS